MTSSLRRSAGNSHRPRTPRDVFCLTPGDETTRRRHVSPGEGFPRRFMPVMRSPANVFSRPQFVVSKPRQRKPLAEPVDSEQTTSAPLEIADNVPVSTQHELLTDF